MAITGLTLSATLDYVSDLDPAKPTPDQAGATVFVLGALDVFVTAHVIDSGLKLLNNEVDFRTNLADVERVRFGLKGLRNLRDAEGNEIEFATQVRIVAGRHYDVASDEVLRILPMPVIQELSAQVRSLSTVTVAEAKN